MRENASSLIQIVAELDQPLCVVDRTGVIRVANEEFSRLVGRTPEALTGQPLGAWLSASGAAALQARLTGTEPSLEPIELIGERTDALQSVLLHVHAAGESPDALSLVAAAPMGVESIGRGVSQTLLDLVAILDNASVGIVFTRDQTIRRCNARAAEIFGYDTPEDLLGKPGVTVYPDQQSYERLGRAAGPLLGSGQSFQSDWLMARADGSSVWCKLFGRAVDPAHPVHGTVWIIEDRSAAKQTEDALHQTLRAMEAIMKNAPVGIMFTRDRYIVSANARFAEMFGYEGDAAIGQPARILYRSDEEYNALGRVAGPLLSQGKPFQMELFMRRRDGSDIYANLIGYVQNPDNPSEGTIWIGEDITEARKTEEALHRTLREMEAIMKNASVAVYFTRDRHLIRYNRRCAEIFGIDGDRGIGMPARAFFRSDAEYEALGRIAGPLLSQGKPFQTELYLRRLDGRDFWANLIGYVQNPNDPSEGTIWIAEDRTAFKQAEEALRLAYAEQQLIFNHSVVGIAFVKNRVLQRCNPRLHEIYGYEPGTLEGQPTRVAYPSDDVYQRIGQVAYEALARGDTFAHEMIHQRRDGTPFWVRVTGKAVDPADPHAASIWNFEDITTRKMAEESLHESGTLQRAILESANLIIFSTDVSGRVVSCNPAAERLLGMPSTDLLGHLPSELLFDAAELDVYRRRLREETGLEPRDGMAALCARPQLGQLEEGEWTFRRGDGTRFPVHLTISPLRESESQVKGFIFVAADISDRKRTEADMQRSRDELETRVRERTAELEAEVLQRRRAEERLKYLALHDSLTGLPNRALLRQRISRAVDRAVASSHLGAVLFIDLDRFKNINDTLGHHVGDALLKEVSRRVASVVRPDDVVARIGGDEFAVVVEAIAEAEQAMAIAQKIHDSLQPVIRVNDHELSATPSIGVALFPRDGGNPDALLRNADAAMYEAKAAGRNAVRFFDPAMTLATENYMKTESSLRRAIDRSEFEPHYQPVVSLSDGRLQQIELLVRWRHPDLGLVLPAQFIPIAEDTGLVASIGAFVMQAACRQLRDWQTRGIAVPKLAVNLSAVQFRDRRLIDGLTQVMEQEGIAPAQIELEITETALMQNGEQTLATLQWLAKAGFSLAVDDFGTGYSSLSYLKRFPVSKLKIDRSFIQDMTKNPDDEAIVQTIIALARTLRLTTIAEGVETAAQRDLLRRFGCDFAQGFLYARPMPAAQLESMFLGHAPIGAAR